jgi:hypothetical protein
MGFRSRRLLGLALLLACSACWMRSKSGNEQHGSRQELTASELAGTPYPSLLEAIESLRGEWLHKRGPTSFNAERDIVVYLDGNRIGGPGALRTIQTATVVTARFLPATEAQQRFGLNHPYGAILVETKL